MCFQNATPLALRLGIIAGLPDFKDQLLHVVGDAAAVLEEHAPVVVGGQIRTEVYPERTGVVGAIPRGRVQVDPRKTGVSLVAQRG